MLSLLSLAFSLACAGFGQVRTALPAAALALSAPLPGAAPGVSAPQAAALGLDLPQLQLLHEVGGRLGEDGSITDLATGVRLPPELLERSGFWLDGSGRPMDDFNVHTERALAKNLHALAALARIGETDPAEAGAALRDWGFPGALEGRFLLDPDGQATFYGKALYRYLHKEPEARGKLSVGRLSRALDELDLAYKRFDAGKISWGAYNLGSARNELLATAPLGGPLPPPALLDVEAEGARLRAAASSPQLGAELRQAALESLFTLARLKGQRHHPELSVGNEAPPAPRSAAPLQRELPALLNRLDALEPEPLSPAKREAWVRAFPSGDIVSRMGAPEFWKQGLTGKGVTVAVIDSGVTAHPSWHPSEVRQLASSLSPFHGTHVAGILHALAPDAKVLTYTYAGAEDPDSSYHGNIAAAIEEAVRAGARIVNMSLGWDYDYPAVREAIARHSKAGVLFVVSAGNKGREGMRWPARIQEALTVGSQDVDGALSDFSSYDERPAGEPAPLGPVKTVWLAPGRNILSTIPGLAEEGAWGLATGTSMATPALAGAAALLLQALEQAGLKDARQAALKLRALWQASARPVVPETAGKTVPDQAFLEVRPAEALKLVE